MKRVNVVVEGPTEALFISEVLAPHLFHFEVFLNSRPVFTSNAVGASHRGGVTYYSRIHQDVRLWCKTDQSATVTTMIDFYGLPPDFPRRGKAREENDPCAEVHFLEQAFNASIGCRNFIPYIQLHEFEALLFTDIEKLVKWYPQFSPAILNLKQEAENFPSPEHINDHPKTAPSKRILKAVPAYRKKLAGVSTLLDIGLDRIRSRCAHFNQWLLKLEALGSQKLSP